MLCVCCVLVEASRPAPGLSSARSPTLPALPLPNTPQHTQNHRHHTTRHNPPPHPPHHDVAARQVLHDEVERLAVLERVEQRHDVRRAHAREHVALGAHVLDLGFGWRVCVWGVDVGCVVEPLSLLLLRCCVLCACFAPAAATARRTHKRKHMQNTHAKPDAPKHARAPNHQTRTCPRRSISLFLSFFIAMTLPVARSRTMRTFVRGGRWGGSGGGWLGVAGGWCWRAVGGVVSVRTPAGERVATASDSVVSGDGKATRTPPHAHNTHAHRKQRRAPRRTRRAR